MIRNLKPCPFCGHLSAPRLSDSKEQFGEHWYGSNDVSFAIVCDASMPNGPGGCGSSSGFCETVEKAIQLWNSRSAKEEAS